MRSVASADDLPITSAAKRTSTGSSSSSSNSIRPDLTVVDDDNATATAVAAATAASLLLSSLEDDDNMDDGDDDDNFGDGNTITEKKNKGSSECLVASILVRNCDLSSGGGSSGSGSGSGGEAPEPLSPTTSVSSAASDAPPGWAERAGLCRGVAVVAASRAAAGPAGSTGRRAGFVRKRSPLGTEVPMADGGDNDDDDSSKKNSATGSREVPRFLRPVMVLLALSLLAIGGARIFRAGGGGGGGGRAGGEGGGRGLVLFGPAAYAAGGVQLQEAVVDDIFERADKDNDGVIGDEEIQFVSLFSLRLFLLSSVPGSR